MEQNFQIYTSYFYQVRNFKPFVVPISTAKYDPKWFHKKEKGLSYIFQDKNGVLNGIRYNLFVPGPSCDSCCTGPENCDTKNPVQCEFLKRYTEQLEKIDINRVFKTLDFLKDYVKTTYKIEKDLIFCFMVYETPKNPCSERRVIQSYFTSRGILCAELNTAKL